MGTNYYYGDKHIGKRSAAGRYCYACKRSTCKEGDAEVHTGRATWTEDGTCFHCGKAFQVRGCCSFSWDMRPGFFAELCDVLGAGGPTFGDEYGGEYSPKEMRALIDECPIKNTYHVGKEFS